MTPQSADELTLEEMAQIERGIDADFAQARPVHIARPPRLAAYGGKRSKRRKTR